MIRTILRSAPALLLYASTATLLAQVIGVGYLYQAGRLKRESIVQVLAVAQGVDLLAIKESTLAERETVGPEQDSLDEFERARALVEKDLDLREQEIANELQRLKYERDSLDGEKQHFDRVRKAFENRLVEIAQGAVTEGEENVRQLMENVRPAQAKQLIMRMVDAKEMDDVVKMMAAMPAAKQAAIAKEFKEDAEVETLSEILRLIREGVPSVELIDETQRQLQPAQATQQ